MPLLLHLCLILKHRLLYARVCKIYMQKKIKKQRSALETLIPRLSLCPYDPKRSWCSALIKEELIEKWDQKQGFSWKACEPDTQIFTLQEVKKLYPPSADSAETCPWSQVLVIGSNPCICVRDKNHTLKVIKAVFTLASFLPYTWKRFCIS